MPATGPQRVPAPSWVAAGEDGAPAWRADRERAAGGIRRGRARATPDRNPEDMWRDTSGAGRASGRVIASAPLAEFGVDERVQRPIEIRRICRVIHHGQIAGVDPV